jgi:hypothetical protein
LKYILKGGTFMENFTPTDAIALQNNRGYDGYGMDGGWFFWIIIILFFAWGNNGFGNNGNNLQTDIDTRFLERDIFSTNQNVSTTGAGISERICDTKYDLGVQTLENRYANQLGLANLGTQVQVGNCDTQKEILQSRYDTALGNQALAAQMAECCCNLRAEGLQNTQKILDKMCETEVQNLRDQLAAVTNQLSQTAQNNTLIAALRPTPTPSYIVSSPYQSLFGLNGCGYNGCGC